MRKNESTNYLYSDIYDLDPSEIPAGRGSDKKITNLAKKALGGTEVTTDRQNFLEFTWIYLNLFESTWVLHFEKNASRTDGRMDGWMDGWTDGQTLL